MDACWAAVLNLALLTLGASVAAGEERMEIGTQKQLFIDDALIASAKNVKLTMNRPVRDGVVVLEGNVPGSHLDWALYNQILKDGDKYKIWYQGRWGGHRWLCYAESDDGRHFKMPELEIVKVGGKPTNAVFPFEPSGFEAGCVMIDTKPGVPAAQRYKAAVRWHKPGTRAHGTFVLTSPDGIHWKALEKQSFRDSDTGNVFFWDERLGRYVAFVRKWDSRGRPVPPRVVARCEFDDPADWGKETIVLASDEQDPPDIDFYTNAAASYEGVYLMFPNPLHHPPKEEQESIPNFGHMDIQLATSRDGIRWTRLDRSPFVPVAEWGQWDSSILYMFTGLVVQRDELWLYYWGRNYPHLTRKIARDRPMVCAFGRLRLRLDGFVSADAAYAGGELVTKPLVFRGSRLELNIQTGIPGEARVELLDAEGKPVPGFAATDADPIKGNFVRTTVTWRGRDDVGALAGKPVQLRFVMRDAKLYAFRFVNPH